MPKQLSVPDLPRSTRHSPLIWISIAILNIVVFAPLTNAGTIKTITPRLTVREGYNDNLDLSPENKARDWITTVLPGILLNVKGEQTNFSLDAQSAWKWYHDDSSRNTKNYRGSIRLDQRLAEYLTFELNDTLLRTDDPITVYNDEVVDVRGGEHTQYQNNGEASLTYVFGADDRMRGGYRNTYIDDRDDVNDDRLSHVGFVNLDKWFGERFGIGFNLSYTNGNFEERDDFRQWNAGATTYYRWNPYHFAYARYTLLDHNYDEDPFYYLGNDDQVYEGRRDYQVHEGVVGVNLALSEYTRLYVDAGYFIQQYRSDYSEDQAGPAFNLSFSTRRERTTMRIDTSGGFDEDYFSTDNFGSSKFVKGLVRFDYRFTETVNLFATIDYRWDDFYEEDVKEDRIRATSGVNYQFWQWYTASVQYTYNGRVSDESSRDYADNRVHLQLQWAYPFQF